MVYETEGSRPVNLGIIAHGDIIKDERRRYRHENKEDENALRPRLEVEDHKQRDQHHIVILPNIFEDEKKCECP